MLRGVSTLSALASELLARLPTMTAEERAWGSKSIASSHVVSPF